ncbi:SDR family oxidoreductase [Paenibacillus macerans]|uniref:SDR family oxidoreductase n=1 Tax=Paenibacillus macerans TaxID=44252 RepID=UPI00204103D3|nr:SDR family oxidoreductase [Paenibacillus macerans]MCM3697943.1 SDR family oxidoreductase [Paenibacillus macerans]
MENIASKVVIITGASSGIGEATAKLLAANGAKVVLAARREERLRQIAGEIRQAGGEASSFQADVASSEDMKKLAQFAIERYGRVDVLVNNAGIMPVSRLSELRVEDWDRMIDVNVKGVLYGIAAVLPIMREQKSGHIINVSSVVGYVVSPTSAVYSATKFAVRAIAEGLRQEESPESGIRSTIIAPGMVETELLNTVTSPDAKQMGDMVRSMSIPPGRIAKAIAYAIGQPDDTSVNEIVVRPTAQPM